MSQWWINGNQKCNEIYDNERKKKVKTSKEKAQYIEE